MGSVKQHQVEASDLKYCINICTKDLTRLRKYGFGETNVAIQNLMMRRRELWKQLRELTRNERGS